MSAGSQRIVCRRCKETITVDDGTCPHCGAKVRGILPFVLAVVFGVILLGTTVLNTELVAFGIVGLFLVLAGGFMLYNRRQRIRQAADPT